MPMDAHENHGDGNSDRSTTSKAPPRVPPRPHRPMVPPRSVHRTSPEPGPTRPIHNNNIGRGRGPVHVQTTSMAVPVPAPAPSLTAERPCGQNRRQNLYVDTPRRQGSQTPPATDSDVTTTGTALVHKNIQANLTRDNHVTVHIAPNLDCLPISHQPQQPEKHVNFDSAHADSVICLKCRKCKCSSCTDSRELPSKWVCGYNVSADSVVETCTCYVCLKGAFYHLFKDRDMDDDVRAEDDPCACCDQRHCCQRWCCISAMSLCLPCLCCYVPLKGLVNALTACYNCCHRRGCRCSQQNEPRDKERERRTSTKRFLLDSSDGSSS